MEALQRETLSWLPHDVVMKLTAERDEAFANLEGDGSVEGLKAFSMAQNNAMLLKFFLEQAMPHHPPGEKLAKIVERDFRGWDQFDEQFVRLASDQLCDWIVLGLSFADFRFHLFSIGDHNPVPFCVSPVGIWCFRADLLQSVGLNRRGLAAAQLSSTNWTAVEHRINCLEEPVDVFDAPQECFSPEGDCGTGSV
jgi:superoxide dismutase